MKTYAFRRDVNMDSGPEWMKNLGPAGMDIHIPGMIF
jgi:hypothetical protein